MFIIDGRAQLTADFTADTTFGCGALANVQFTDLSSGNITSWSWDFGNGNTSTNRNPLANFSSTGQFTVQLTVSDGSNSATETKTAYINVYRNPTAAISTSATTSGCPPLAVTFNSSSTPGDGNITQYIWDFGDGSPAGTNASETHSYLTGGNYNPTLQIIDQFGCTDNAVFNSINVTPAPQARFSTSNSRVGCTVPQTVNFVDNSIGSNLSYLWDFGDGSTSNQQNPSHTYTTLGDYNVSLRVTDPNCSDTRVQNNYVRINTVNVAYTLQDTVCLGQAIRPINQSLGTTLYRWDFGDGNSSTDENPTHTYDTTGWFKIRLTGSSGSVCLGSYTDSVYVIKMSATPIINDTSFCGINDIVQLSFTSQNVKQFYWKHGGNSFDSSFSNPVQFAPLRNGTFRDTLVISNQFGCIDTLTNIPSRTVKFLKAIIVLDSSNGCLPFVYDPAGSSNGADSIISWEWDFSTLGSSNLKDPNPINVTTRGDYLTQFKITSLKGCTDSISTLIEVGEKQTLTYVLPKDSLCKDDTAFVQHISPDPSTIDSLIYTATSILSGNEYIDTVADYSFTNFLHTGLHRIKIRANDNGCITETTVDSTFYVKGPLASFAFKANCTNRFMINFTSFVQGTGKYYWDFGDGNIDSSSQNPVHTYLDTGRYYVKFYVKDTLGNCPTDTSYQEVYVNQPSNERPLYNRKNLCFGDSLNSLFYGIGRDYYWVLDNDTFRSNEVIRFGFDTTGYQYIDFHFIDLLGCDFIYTDTFFVSKVQADFSFIKKDTCLPSEIVFESQSTSDTTFTSYLWDFGNGDTSIVAKDSVIYNAPGKYDISLQVVDAIGCTDSIKIEDAFETDFLTVDFTASQTVLCEGGSTFFINTSKGRIDSVLWNFGDGNTGTGRTPTHFFTTPGKFDVSLTIIDSLGCKQTLTKTELMDIQPKPIADFTSDTSISSCYPLAVNFEDLTTPTPAKWNWDFGDNSSSIFQDPFKNYTLPGNYDVSLMVETSAGCKDTVIKPAYIQTAGPTAQIIVNKDTACINEAITFEMINAQGVFDFTWDFGDGNTSKNNPATHSYSSKIGVIYPSLIISNSNGSCVVPLKDTIVIENVKANFNVDSIHCGLPALVNFTNTSLGASTNQWSIDGNSFTTADANYTFNQAGFYQVRLTIASNLGCNDFEEKTIKIVDNPKANTTADTGICIGDSLQINASGGLRYEWTPNYRILNSNQATATVYPDTTTTYYVKVFDQDDCFDTDSVKVIVPEYIGPLQISDTSLFLGEGWSFSIPFQEGFNYSWTPTKGLSCTDCHNPFIAPSETTTYTLEIKDDYGCISKNLTFTMEILDLFSVDVPNAFTPNGDLNNDVIFVNGWGIKTLNYFRIYNRFGELVFESNSLDRGWDGRYKGKIQASDTYAFTVEVESFNGEILTKKGNITLLR